jgi:hypothetical protein
MKQGRLPDDRCRRQTDTLKEPSTIKKQFIDLRFGGPAAVSQLTFSEPGMSQTTSSGKLKH